MLQIEPAPIWDASVASGGLDFHVRVPVHKKETKQNANCSRRMWILPLCKLEANNWNHILFLSFPHMSPENLRYI